MATAITMDIGKRIIAATPTEAGMLAWVGLDAISLVGGK